MSIATRTVGPEDHGRRMSLKDFDRTEGREGYVYELSRGIVIVSDVPRPSHGAIMAAIRDLFIIFKHQNPGRIYNVFGGGDCKILLWDLESERHPDVVVYTTGPESDSAAVWSSWVPDLVVEVVSPDSVERDYELKREEYLAFGIREYWIVDPFQKTMTVLVRRAGKWVEKAYEPGDVYECKKYPGVRVVLSEILA